MKHFFLNAMAVADLSRGVVERRPLPDDVLSSEDASRLVDAFPGALVLTAGSLTGSFAPASGLVTIYADGKTSFVTGHVGRALRLCALDAVVVTGKADAPVALLLDEKGGTLSAADPDLDAPAQRAAFTRMARAASCAGDAVPLSLLAGPAAFHGCASPCLIHETGVAPRTAPAASAMAKRRLAGIGFHGGAGFVSPVPMDGPLRQAVPAERVSAASLAALWKVAGFGAGAQVSPGRSLACFACPAPCGFWLSLDGGFVACTAPEALAALLGAGATQEKAARILALGESYGVDPLALAPLAAADTLPDTLDACAKAASPLPGRDEDDALNALAAAEGVCPFFLKRFPAAKAALEAFRNDDNHA